MHPDGLQLTPGGGQLGAEEAHEEAVGSLACRVSLGGQRPGAEDAWGPGVKQRTVGMPTTPGSLALR